MSPGDIAPLELEGAKPPLYKLAVQHLLAPRGRYMFYCCSCIDSSKMKLGVTIIALLVVVHSTFVAGILYNNISFVFMLCIYQLKIVLKYWTICYNTSTCRSTLDVRITDYLL